MRNQNRHIAIGSRHCLEIEMRLALIRQPSEQEEADENLRNNFFFCVLTYKSYLTCITTGSEEESEEEHFDDFLEF